MEFQSRGYSRVRGQEVRDARKPLYMYFVLDTSSSMAETSRVGGKENGAPVKKIDQLNEGMKKALDSLRRFERENVLYKVYYQVVELNSYGQALFPAFVPLSGQPEEVCFHAEGVTCLENSLATLKQFIHPKYMPGCNHAINVILMSDGYPTDVEGYVVSPEVYKKSIDGFRSYLEKKGYRQHVDLYAIGVGKDACEDMLRYFADEDRYFRVEESESLATKLDFVTRCSLVARTSRPISAGRRDVSRPISGSSVSFHGEREPDDAGVGSASPVTLGSYLSGEERFYEIDSTLCLNDACLLCVEACQLGAIDYTNGRVSVLPVRCTGCGACLSGCPTHAIHLFDENGEEG